MNVLKDARHRAGMNFAVWKVSFWLVIAMAFWFAACLFVGYSERTQWMLIVLMGLVVAIIIAPSIGYAVARRDPALIRKELTDMIRCEEMLLPMYEAELAKWMKELEDLPQTQRVAIENAWKERLQAETDDLKRKLETTINDLREADNRVSPKQKICDQEIFLGLNQSLQECESALGQLQRAEYAPPSEEAYRAIERATRGSFEKWHQVLNANKAVYEAKISASRHMIAEAQRYLQNV